MTRPTIHDLIQDLEKIPSTNSVFNPYQSPACRQNLEAYLEALCARPFSGHLLVGEALGYRGGARTGIPFSSSRLLRAHPHPFLVALRLALIIHGDTAEATATVVWDYLKNCGEVPAFWNIFPFHPHQKGDKATNRKPNALEKEIGRGFLDLVIKILNPQSIIAVGRVAELALARRPTQQPISAIRHPSHGGKKGFIAGLIKAGIGPSKPESWEK